MLLGTSAGSTVAAQLGSGSRSRRAVRPAGGRRVGRDRSGRRHRRHHRAVRHRDDRSRTRRPPRSCSGSARSRCRPPRVAESVRREVIAAATAVARLAGPGAADHRDRHRDRRAGRVRPGIGCRAGRRGGRQLRRAGRLAAGDDRRAGATWTAGWAAPSTWRSPTTAMWRWCWCRRVERRRHRSAAAAAAEIADFHGSAFGVFADDESLRAFGANPLDPACRVPSARAGREQGRRVAGDDCRLPWRLNQLSSAGVAGLSRMSSARAASSCPTSMTSAARWNSRLRQAAARHLDEHVGWIVRELVARQRRLRDVDGPVHHLEAAQLGHRCFLGAVDEFFVAVVVGFGIRAGAEPARASTVPSVYPAGNGPRWCRAAQMCCGTTGSAIPSCVSVRSRSARRGRRPHCRSG